MNKIFALIALVFLVLLSSCAKPMVVACREIAQDSKGEFKYTAEQARVACDRAQLYADPNLFRKEKGQWELNPDGLPVSEVKKVVEDMANSLHEWLSYENRENADLVDWFKGFREGLEKEEAVAKEILRRLNYVNALNEFTDAVGELPPEMQVEEFSYFFPAGRKFYSMRILYPVKQLENILFTAKYLEVAKKDGTLKLVGTFEVASQQQFAKRVPDLYDPNDFKWEKEEKGWVIKSYKIMPAPEKPMDNVVHYIEIFRRNANGMESKPAVRGFMVAGGSKVSIFIVDYDKEGISGYGSPDGVIIATVDIVSGKDIFGDSFLREKLLEAIFEDPQNHSKEGLARKKPKDKPIYTAIVRMGELKLDMWEEGNWAVPFDYQEFLLNIEIVYAKSKTVEETKREEKEKLKRIELFQREFKQEGKTVVIEYWIPKKEYAVQDISYSLTFNDEITIRIKDQEKKSGGIGFFGDKKKMIVYNFGGKWFQILDENGDGIFEKKKEIADPIATASTVTSDTPQAPADGSYF